MPCENHVGEPYPPRCQECQQIDAEHSPEPQPKPSLLDSLRADAARAYNARRRASKTISPTLARVERYDRTLASQMRAYLAILAAESRAQRQYAAALAHEIETNAGSEGSVPVRVDSAAGARSAEHESDGLSTRRPHTVGNTGIEGADLLG